MIKKKCLVILMLLCILFSEWGLFCENNEVNAAESTAEVVVVLDPGHDSTHAGAAHYGYKEQDLVFKIASYCKEELEKYSGVTVYMTRTSAACPFGSSTSSSNCLIKRVEYAKSVNADVFISFHLNALENASQCGACVFYPNSNYKAEFGTEGKKLATNILTELKNLGISQSGQGILYRNSSDYTYPNGSVADYLSVIRNAKLQGVPAVLIEHAYLSNYSDVTTFLNTDQKLQKIGIADATAIANYLGLSRNIGVYQGSDGNWYYYVNGVVDTSYEGLAENKNGWWYIKNGKVDFSYNGLVTNKNGTWYLKNGKIDFSYSGLYSDETGSWYVKNGEVHYDINGVVHCGDGWYYFKNGKVQTDTTTVAHNSNGWWYVKNGKVDFSYNGIGKSGNDSWFIRNGKVDFSVNGLVACGSGLYYFKSGKVDTSVTTVMNNANGWWYVKKGVVDLTETTIAQNKNGWWYIKNGKVDFGYNGVGTNENGTWYIKDGKVDFSKSGLLHCGDGWYYFQGGWVDTGLTTVTNNANGWWYVKNGKVDFTANTVAQNKNGWWYIMNGKVDFSYNGVGTNKYGTWYIKDGKVDFNKNGLLHCGDGWYYFQGGWVDTGLTTVTNNANGWWYIKNGKVDFNHNGLGTNENGTWYIRNGKVDFSVNGLVLCGQERWYFKNGAVDYTFNGSVKEGNTYYIVINGLAFEEGTSIMGDSSVTKEQMVVYYNTRATYPTFYANSDAPTIEDFCQIYLEECEAEGVKAEVAFAQAMLETGFLRYGEQVDISQYNFAGLGAVGGGSSGASFSDVRTGIRAQVQHLKAYACDDSLNNVCVDPRFKYVTRGCAPYVEWLGIQENPYGKGWASAEKYGFTIRNNYIEKLLNTK